LNTREEEELFTVLSKSERKNNEKEKE